MGSISVNKLGALFLIVGPVLALVFFSLQPGSLLIESAEPSNPVASIRAFASNAALTNVTGLAVALGLVMTTVGLYVLQSGVRDGGTGDALSRAGLILIVFGNVGWVLDSVRQRRMGAGAGVDAGTGRRPRPPDRPDHGARLHGQIGHRHYVRHRHRAGVHTLQRRPLHQGRLQQDRRADSGPGIPRRHGELHRGGQFNQHV